MGSAFFEEYALETVELAAGRMRLRRGGEGPPLLLLHGNPQTHAMWHSVAPALGRRYCVLCPGHYLAEEAPGAVIERMVEFFT